MIWGPLLVGRAEWNVTPSQNRLLGSWGESQEQGPRQRGNLSPWGAGQELRLPFSMSCLQKTGQNRPSVMVTHLHFRP